MPLSDLFCLDSDKLTKSLGVLGTLEEELGVLPQIIYAEFAQLGRLEYAEDETHPRPDRVGIILCGEDCSDRDTMKVQCEARLTFGLEVYKLYARWEKSLRLCVIGNSDQCGRLFQAKNQLGIPGDGLMFIEQPEIEIDFRLHLEKLLHGLISVQSRTPIIVVSDIQYFRVQRLLQGCFAPLCRKHALAPRLFAAPWVLTGRATTQEIAFQLGKAASDIEAGYGYSSLFESYDLP